MLFGSLTCVIGMQVLGHPLFSFVSSGTVDAWPGTHMGC